MKRIEDYGFLSDTQTAALVSCEGSIDWLCLPRFDSPASFAALLGDEENGTWKIAPTAPVIRRSRQYRDGSLILETEFETAGGCVRLIDFMPLRDEHPDVVRIVEGVRGRVDMAMKMLIRFEYGEVIPWVRHYDGGIVATAGPDALILRSDVETHGENLATVADFTVQEGDRVAFVLTWFPSNLEPPKAIKSDTALRRTEKYWREWSGECHIDSPWEEAVKRSLLVLKGLTYEPTGGIVAAATTSLPEALGGERNWDYRFCWLRDATFTLQSFLNAGYVDEAADWRDWLVRAAAGSPEQMQILYGVAGERRLTEFELPHLRGFGNSTPVRVGNAASAQFQLDVYGEVIDALHLARERGLKESETSIALQKHLVDYVVEHWREPDEGIWEVRGGRRHFTHSKMMAWVALDRAVQVGEQHDPEGDWHHWRRVRDEIHREVCARGFDAKRGAFTQSFDCDRLDASLLMMPLVGFLPADDHRVRSTIDTISEELLVDGFVLRYHPDDSGPVDGLPPGEGAFLPCTFWLADCLSLLGRQDEAVEIFERLLAIRNDLGLLAEEYDPHRKMMLGNYPQAFSHVGLVNTASYLVNAERAASERCHAAQAA